MAAVLKTEVPQGTVGSNPTRSASLWGTMHLTYHESSPDNTPDRPTREIDFKSEHWEAKLPSLLALRVTPEMMEVAEGIASASDVEGLETSRLESLVRAIVYLADRRLD